jgi:hypothetical protein
MCRWIGTEHRYGGNSLSFRRRPNALPGSGEAVHFDRPFVNSTDENYFATSIAICHWPVLLSAIRVTAFFSPANCYDGKGSQSDVC